MVSQRDLTEAIDAIAEKLTGIEVGYPPFRTVWEYLGSHRSAEYRDKARELLDLAAPILERQIRQQITQEMRLGTIAACWPSMHGDGPVATAIRELRDRLIAIAQDDIAAATETTRHPQVDGRGS